MPQEVLEQYEHLRAELTAAMPPQAYVYPAQTLHCTILTMRSFIGGPMSSAVLGDTLKRWEAVLTAARVSEKWPSGPFRIRLAPPSLEGSAGIFRGEDCDGAIAKMRECLQEAISAAGGSAAIGDDRSGGQALPGSHPSEPVPHVPNIVHSTALRWTSEPPDRAMAHEVFERVAAQWKPVEVTVPCARAVLEDVPYMHIPCDDAHVWWESES